MGEIFGIGSVILAIGSLTFIMVLIIISIIETKVSASTIMVFVNGVRPVCVLKSDIFVTEQ